MTTIQINPNELANKRVLVTGGTKGMGEAIVSRSSAPSRFMMQPWHMHLNNPISFSAK